MTAFISPVYGGGAQLFNNAGAVLNGGKIYTYYAGTTTPTTTWTDATQAVQNANPIVLDSAGRPPNQIWLAQGVSYKFVVTDANGATVGPAIDNVTGSPAAGAGAHTIWVPAYAMFPSSTNGGAYNSIETPTNKIVLKTIDFADGATVLSAQFSVRFPKSWDASTITASFVWTANSTSTAGIVLGIKALATSSGDVFDNAYGTPQIVVSNNAAVAYTNNTTVATPAVTINNAPAPLDTVFFNVYRDPTNVSDTLAATVSLIGVNIYYNTIANSDS